MQESFTLDGREFRAVEQSLTAAQDDYILGQLRLSGALEVLSGADGKERTKEAQAQELLTRVLVSGRAQHILAGCLTEEGKRWTRAEADRNASIFAEITDPDEKKAMRDAIVRLVIGFFSFGSRSSETSPSSSIPAATDPPIASAEAAT
jgi:hypothetical protein